VYVDPVPTVELPFETEDPVPLPFGTLEVPLVLDAAVDEEYLPDPVKLLLFCFESSYRLLSNPVYPRKRLELPVPLVYNNDEAALALALAKF